MTKIHSSRIWGVLFVLIAACAAVPGAFAHGRARVFIGFSGAYFAPYPVYPYPYYAEPPDYALVDTDVEPEKAAVYLDGERLGIADEFDGFPRYLAVSPGRHTIEFRAPGYRTFRVRLRARRGAMYDIDRHLNPAGEHSADAADQEMQMGEPESSYHPRGRPRGGGISPRRSEPSERDEQSPGAEEDEQRGQHHEAEEDEPRGQHREEDAEEALVVFKIRPDDAAVYLDDKFLGAGETLGGPEGVKVSPGRHRLQIVKPGYVPYRTTLNVRPGQTRTVAFQLERGRREGQEDEPGGPDDEVESGP